MARFYGVEKVGFSQYIYNNQNSKVCIYYKSKMLSQTFNDDFDLEVELRTIYKVIQ